MAYIDDFIRDNAGTMTRDQLTASLRGAGYGDGEIRAALRRSGGSQAAAAGVSPSVPGVPASPRPTGRATLPRSVRIGGRDVPIRVVAIGALMAAIVIGAVVSGGLDPVAVFVFAILAYRMRTLLSGQAAAHTASSTGGKSRPLTRQNWVRTLVIVLGVGLVVAMFLARLGQS